LFVCTSLLKEEVLLKGFTNSIINTFIIKHNYMAIMTEKVA